MTEAEAEPEPEVEAEAQPPGPTRCRSSSDRLAPRTALDQGTPATPLHSTPPHSTPLPGRERMREATAVRPGAPPGRTARPGPETPRAEAQEKSDVPCKAGQIEPGDTDGTRDGGPA
ncbi:hypothetical protein [Streptomyces nigrescens]|uniref:hypothetical protein n=1 Tax=Streptomyces nigrescens TaxID=1920 RepID=UPI003479C887